MNSLGTIFGREPVLILSLVQAIIILVTSFGLNLTKEQTAAIILVAQCILSVIARQQVTPVN